jgi:hypothetical protein
MNPLHAPGPAPLSTPESSLEACDEDTALLEHGPRYCPTGLLASFTLLMSGHGRCVNAAMMLGDREYAMWQLACARTLDDVELGEIAARLFKYFDDPQVHQPVPGTA